MKKLLTLCMSAILTVSALAFVACSPSSGSDDYLLTIAYDNGGYGRVWLDEAVEKFCAQEGIDKDKVLVEAEKGVTEAMETHFDSETMIRDVCITEESTQRKWAAQGYLEPLDDVFAATLSSGKTVESVLKEGYKDLGYLKTDRLGEHYYLFPFTQGAGGIYYNKTLFEQKGWKLPQTFDELKSLCKKIFSEEVVDQPDKDKQIYPLVCSSDISNYWDFVVENWWVQLLGIEEYRNFCKFDKPELFVEDSVYGKTKIEALNAFADLTVADAVSGAERKWVITDSADYNAAQMLFCQGRAAMMPNGAWLESEMRASIPEGMEIALMPTPYLANAKKDAEGNYIRVNYSCSANSMFIPAKAAHKELAKKFIVFLSEEAQVKAFVAETGSPRPFNYAIDNLEGLTACQKSVIEAWQNSQNFVFITTSKLSVTGIAFPWKKGYPYGQMIFKDANGNRKSGADYVKEEAEFVATEWNNWIANAEL